MKRQITLAFYVALIASVIIHDAPAANNQNEILKATGVKGGLIVHLNCGDGKLTAALHPNDSYVVQGLDADANNVVKAREYIRSLGLYGKVTIDLLRGSRLPYVDNLVNLLVSEDLGTVPMSEVMRVLCPNGVAYIKKNGKWTKTVKPWPDNIDEWTHALHDSSNNAVANDLVVGPPHHIQWVAGPKNARHHERLASISVVVSAGGRIFYIIDEAPTASILLRPRWTLVARDAFNGVVLWKRRIHTWESYMRGFRSGPPALSRRLVATKEKVYVTLGLRAPLSALDAATGKTVKTYEGTTGTEEILYHDGTLFIVVSDSAGKKPQKSTQPAGKGIMALDAETGKVLWKKPNDQPLPTAIAAAGERVFFQTSEAIISLNSKTGEQLWRYDRPAAVKRPSWSAPTLVVHDNVVLCADRRADLLPPKKARRWNGSYSAGGPGELVALSADTGKKLWTNKCAETFHAPVDVFVANGLVWIGEARLRRNADFKVGRDLLTGEIKKRISTDKAFRTTMPHHRCYRNKATDRYIVVGRTGVEFIDIVTGATLRHHWIRGVCQYGVIPCNGLLYLPPHSCACYIEAKLAGFYALAAKEESIEGQVPTGSRLEGGPAYDQSPDTRRSTPDTSRDWPTYRHDASRSGSTKTSVPVNLRLTWQAELGGKLSSPTIADGKVFVASVNAHTVHALDAGSGKPLWHYTAGGRIDSPPTIHKRLVVFGSADGWVYCLRSSDGKLVWKFRAAPEERRAMSFGQVESPWPVHGSVLIQDDPTIDSGRAVVYCAAGRSSYIDGGIYLYRLDLMTGKKLSEKCIYSRNPKTGEQPGEPQMFEMPGAFPDVLSSDGELIYMRRLGFDRENLQQREPRPHLYSPAGFLNADWWHRTYWIFGTHFYSGYIGWYFAGREVPSGRILAIDESTIYGFAYQPDFYRGSTGRKYHLFAANRKSQPPQSPHDYRRASRDYPPRGRHKFKVKFQWSKNVPLLAWAMVLAGPSAVEEGTRTGKTLFIAGPPDRALRSTPILEGKRGGLLYVVSAADGETLKKYKLDSLPVFDGMAAANGRLYVSTKDGKLLCMGKEGEHIPEVTNKKKRQLAGTPIEAGLVGYWKLDDGKGEIAADSSGMGNDAEVYGQWVKGKFGICLSTDGTPGAVTLYDGQYLHFGTSDFSIEFWVKVDAFRKRIMGKENYPQTWWVINLLDDGRVEMVLGETNVKGKMVRPTSKTPLSKDKWCHVAFVVDRKNFEVKCYMNGTLDSVTKIPSTLTGSLSVEGKDLMIPSSFRPFVGLFDELRIYRRTLTDVEVKQSYEKEKDNRASVEFGYIEE